jgi:hypothetical protein
MFVKSKLSKYGGLLAVTAVDFTASTKDDTTQIIYLLNPEKRTVTLMN